MVAIFATIIGCGYQRSITIEPASFMRLQKDFINTPKDNSLPTFQYSSHLAGTSTTLNRSYENAPPLIPHAIEGFDTISKDKNRCIGCHESKQALSLGAVPISKTHYVNFSTKKLSKKVSPQRYLCTSCHIPQSDAPMLRENLFEPLYLEANSTKRSYLMHKIKVRN